MAEKTSVFTLTWENGKELKLTRSDDGGATITILNVEENGSWDNWSSMAAVMNGSFANKVATVGTDMKN